MTSLILAAIELAKEVAVLKATVQFLKETPPPELFVNWATGDRILSSLHISERFLQKLRDNNKLAYSCCEGKLYYKVSEVEAILNKNYGYKKDKHMKKGKTTPKGSEK